MQTDLGDGGLEDGEGAIVASYTYAARYGYSGDVLHNDNQIRLLPREGEGQRALGVSVWTLPDGSGVRYGDRFGNGVHRARVVDVHSTLVVATAGRVSLSTAAPTPPDAPLDAAKELPQGWEFLMPSPLVNPDSVAALARSVAGGTRSLLETARLATDWIYREILYKRGSTGVATTAAQVVEAMEGVCQDKTHLGLGMLRSLGAPCRYVSGLLTGQVGETHSWMEFLHPQAGWLGADPTRGVICPPARDYVKLAVGRDYTDVSPVNGSFLSKGEATDCAAIASVKFEDSEATLSDALALLEDAYVVRNG